MGCSTSTGLSSEANEIEVPVTKVLVRSLRTDGESPNLGRSKGVSRVSFEQVEVHEFMVQSSKPLPKNLKMSDILSHEESLDKFLKATQQVPEILENMVQKKRLRDSIRDREISRADRAVEDPPRW